MRVMSIRYSALHFKSLLFFRGLHCVCMEHLQLKDQLKFVSHRCSSFFFVGYLRTCAFYVFVKMHLFILEEKT